MKNMLNFNNKPEKIIDMKNITNNFQKIFTAIAFAEGGEFETAKQIMEEVYAKKRLHSYSNEISPESLKRLKAHT